MLRSGAAALLALVLAGCSPVPGVVSEPLSEHLHGRGRNVVVERVVDGDTLAVSGDERVRLLSVDAPELGRRSTPADDECGAQVAADALAVLLPAGTPVVLNGLKGEPERDRYGRTLANAYVQRDGELINVSLWLVANGHAVAYGDYPTTDTPEAERLESDARTTGRGIWGACR